MYFTVSPGKESIPGRFVGHLYKTTDAFGLFSDDECVGKMQEGELTLTFNASRDAIETFLELVWQSYGHWFGSSSFINHVRDMMRGK